MEVTFLVLPCHGAGTAACHFSTVLATSSFAPNPANLPLAVGQSTGSLTTAMKQFLKCLINLGGQCPVILQNNRMNDKNII